MNDALSDARKMAACAISAGVADAPKGHGLGQRRFPLRASREAVEHAGVSRTWCDGIDAHTRLGPFERGGLRQAFHGVLARGIDRCTGRPFVTVGRGYVDDAAVTLRLHDAQLV